MLQRYEYEKELSSKFESNLLQVHSLAPGITKNTLDLLVDFHNDEYSFMCSVGVRKEIEKKFGKSNCSVTGKERMAKFFAFTYKEQLFICTCESGSIGTGWYWVKSKEEGSRYGKAMLLPSDSEVKDFWPDFCYEFKEIVEDKTRVIPRVKQK